MKRMVLISCSSKKKKYKSQAQNLYDSVLFKLSLDYAKLLRPNKIYILSALHYLVNIDEEIEPYDNRLSKNKSEIQKWSENVINGLSKVTDLEKDEFIFIAGADYTNPLKSSMTNVHEPLKNLKIGKRMKKLKELIMEKANNFSIEEIFDKLHFRYIIPENEMDIPNESYMVYVLVYNDKAIVVGSGRKNRAKVIFDNATSHFKALLVRLYTMYGNNNFTRYILECQSKSEAAKIEKKLHNHIGGNTREIPNEILELLFRDISNNERILLFLNIALLSSYDGISDLQKWHRKNLINADEWEIISNKLNL
jgi:hypothetical protein